jgi:hypothetical protein
MQEDCMHYDVKLYRNGSLITKLQHIRRSPNDEQHYAADSPHAIDRVAEAALSFGCYHLGDDVGAFAEMNEDDGWIVTRHK